MSLLLLFHPRAGAGPTPAARVYEGRRPQADEDEEELAVVLALFRQLVGEDVAGP